MSTRRQDAGTGEFRVIFLDFDGVVVCQEEHFGRTTSGRTVRNANPEPVAQLNRIIEATGAFVVVSSTWRLHPGPLEHLQGTLSRAGFTGQVIGVTPDLRGQDRGHEVQAWLDEHPEVTSYISLDDGDDLGPISRDRWLLIHHGWFHGGLTAEYADRAIEVLLTPTPPRTPGAEEPAPAHPSKQGDEE